MAVTDINLSTDMYSEIRSILVSANPIVTNSSSSATTAASIYAEYNDKTMTRPQIVLHSVSPELKAWKFGDTTPSKFVTVIIDCYYTNSLGIDQLYDQVVYALENNRVDNLELVGITSDIAFNVASNNKYQMKSVILTYDRE